MLPHSILFSLYLPTSLETIPLLNSLHMLPLLSLSWQVPDGCRPGLQCGQAGFTEEKEQGICEYEQERDDDGKRTPS